MYISGSVLIRILPRGAGPHERADWILDLDRPAAIDAAELPLPWAITVRAQLIGKEL
jgi:hypothetical protein